MIFIFSDIYIFSCKCVSLDKWPHSSLMLFLFDIIAWHWGETNDLAHIVFFFLFMWKKTCFSWICAIFLFCAYHSHKHIYFEYIDYKNCCPNHSYALILIQKYWNRICKNVFMPWTFANIRNLHKFSEAVSFWLFEILYTRWHHFQEINKYFWNLE